MQGQGQELTSLFQHTHTMSAQEINYIDRWLKQDSNPGPSAVKASTVTIRQQRRILVSCLALVVVVVVVVFIDENAKLESRETLYIAVDKHNETNIVRQKQTY